MMTCFCFEPLCLLVLYAKEHIRRKGLSKTTQCNRLVALHIPPLRYFSNGFSLTAEICLPFFCQPPFSLTFLSVNPSLLNHFSVNYSVNYCFHFFSRLISLPSHIFPFRPLCPLSFSRETSHALRILTNSATMASPASAVPVLPPMSLVLSPASMAARTASSTILASWARFREYRNIMATERMVPMGF